ncbi:MAG: hypothetical protein HY438_01385 [DPANN group archaeon]|nr:hypothetical protein [DPANN group archaeon]
MVNHDRIEEEVIKKEQAFLDANLDKIKAQHGEHTLVAICGQQIVDSDKSEIELLKRLEKRFPNELVLYTSVYLYQNGASESEPLHNCAIKPPRKAV